MVPPARLEAHFPLKRASARRTATAGCAPCPIGSSFFPEPAFLKGAVERVAGEVFPGLPTCPYIMTGGTDAAYYQSICDACVRFSPVVFGPDQMKGMHGLNENVDTFSLPGAVDFYKAVIRANK